jgi:DNA-binding LacI/PurR family transcriptional regulator
MHPVELAATVVSGKRARRIRKNVEPPPKRTRIADVAREAGVSKTAVSFAFNKPEQLSPSTASRILEVASALGYRPHPVARMLTQRRTMSIGIVTPQALSTTFANSFFGQFSEGVALVAEEGGYGLTFISPERGSLASALDRATVDGLIVVGLTADDTEIDRIRAAGIPIVLVDSTALPDTPSIRVDDERGAYEAAAHVLDLGHRDILLLAISPPAPYPPGRDHGVGPDRLRGYVRAFRDRSLDFPEHRRLSAPSTIDGGRRAFHAAWETGIRPTAVIAMSDAIAIGVLSAARSLGLRIPADLSIVGFDDIDVAAHTDPPLTTVHQPIRRKGEAAMRTLLSLVDDGHGTLPETPRLKTHFIVRGSTGPPRAA